MNYIPLKHPVEVRDGNRWHEGHKHFEYEILLDGTTILQSRHKDRIVQLYYASDGKLSISSFYEIGGKFYPINKGYDVPNLRLNTSVT